MIAIISASSVSHFLYNLGKSIQIFSGMNTPFRSSRHHLASGANKYRNRKFHFHLKKMVLSTYEDFLQLGMNCLQDYLSARGLNTTGEKIELVARASAAFEMNFPIIASSEEQQKKLKLDYENRLQKFKICDPLSIEPPKRIHDLLQWPHIDTRVIFAYILKVKDCDLEYVGRSKDQKAYSYFNSGFVDTIFIYNPSSCRNKIFLYSKIQSSLTVSDKKCCGY